MSTIINLFHRKFPVITSAVLLNVRDTLLFIFFSFPTSFWSSFVLEFQDSQHLVRILQTLIKENHRVGLLLEVFIGSTLKEASQHFKLCPIFRTKKPLISLLISEMYYNSPVGGRIFVNWFFIYEITLHLSNLCLLTPFICS